MGQANQVNTGRALEHVHGVHVIQHSPFELEEITQNGSFRQSTHERLTIGVNQLLRVHTVQLVAYNLFLLTSIYFSNILDDYNFFHIFVSLFRYDRRVWQQRPSCLRPINSCLHGTNNAFIEPLVDSLLILMFIFLNVLGDRHLGERVANILTSIPFIAVGIQAPRHVLYVFPSLLNMNEVAKLVCGTVWVMGHGETVILYGSC